ncbi:unnamed protein product [Symbiodinium natans]|uniref:Uncharacterized protein n=1 Tax=Symbiodinium natans TaxID=878477 RepID=A0A812PEI8_9DINO|nr:unnamed protein product [Symbiodinium natans]
MAAAASSDARSPPVAMSDKNAAAQAFTDRLNATPASGSEADRFREADDRLKGLPPATVKALQRFGDAPPPEVVTCMAPLIEGPILRASWVDVSRVAT